MNSIDFKIKLHPDKYLHNNIPISNISNLRSYLYSWYNLVTTFWSFTSCLCGSERSPERKKHL